MMKVPFRQVHLDFHTSEHIPGIGKDYNAARFIACLHTARVNWINVFAKCHHGWSYYPTQIGHPHPNISKDDLLGEIVHSCRSAEIAVGIYISVQYDEFIAREHPDWQVISNDFMHSENNSNRKEKENSEEPKSLWKPICLSNKEYIQYVLNQALEVIERYHPDGLWMDILNVYDCSCPNCLHIMSEKGTDSTCRNQRLSHHRDLIMDYYRKFYDAVSEKDPEVGIFHNSGHIFKGDRERYKYFSHLELESLPTGGWGYDHFPVSAKYAGTLGMNYVGMTGKFHTNWGEFGGYKTSSALEYECCSMIAYGARCSIGDQLHPTGVMDEDTYRLIRPAYERVASLESFVENSSPFSEIALLSAEAHLFQCGTIVEERGNTSDDGAARMLMELQEQFDIIDWEQDFAFYKLLILPDLITLDNEKYKKLTRFLKKGGSLILSGSSGMRMDQNQFLLDIGGEYAGKMGPYAPDYILADKKIDPDLPSSPFVIYDRPYAVKAADAEILAESRVPYFNRTTEHFCSHQHTPYSPERNELYDAVIRKENIIYFSHPIFSSYYKSGQPHIKYLFRGALNKSLPNRQVQVKMPSCGRISFMRRGKDLLLHLFCAQPQLRGHDVLPQKGHKQIEIIEDIIPIYDIPCVINILEEPNRVYSAYTGMEIQYQFKNGRLSFVVKEVDIHELIVIETNTRKEAPME